jgi:hypothetical protein
MEPITIFSLAGSQAYRYISPHSQQPTKEGKMKKALVVVGIVAAVVFAANSAFAFGVPSVPKSVSDVANAPKDAAYDSCKAWANSHKNNMSYNSSNIENEMKGKEFSGLIYEKDWRKGGSDYDKKHQRLELRATYNEFATVKVRCNNEKCSSIWCNKN